MKDHYNGERRKDSRIYLPFPTTVEGINSEGAVFRFSTILDDFSAGGLRLRVAEKVMISSEMKVTVKFSSVKKTVGEITINGKVIRVVSKPGGAYEVAMKIEKHQFL
jgi:c-di-GMP-binding flagellar brake protein YcgR